MTFPDDSVQSLVDGDWWEEVKEDKPSRGSLVFAFVPHVDQRPFTVKEVSRAHAKEHKTGLIDIAPLEMKAPRRRSDLPVAAMTLYANELWLAYRGKKRPCLVLGEDLPDVDKGVRRDMPRILTAPVVLAAPYYGADKDGLRAGYNPAFVENIRHAEYAQFFWDKLPFPSKTEESVLRFDHLQPIGTNQNSYEMSGYRLSDEAMVFIDDWLQWVVWGGVPSDSNILLYRELLAESY